MSTDLAEWLAAQDIPGFCKTRLKRLSYVDGLTTIERLCACSYSELCLLENLGRKSLDHLTRCLAAEGHYLRGSEPRDPDSKRKLIADLWSFIERDEAMNGEIATLRERVRAIMRKREP